jgi:hypothetical protein
MVSMRKIPNLRRESNSNHRIVQTVAISIELSLFIWLLLHFKWRTLVSVTNWEPLFLALSVSLELRTFRIKLSAQRSDVRWLQRTDLKRSHDCVTNIKRNNDLEYWSRPCQNITASADVSHSLRISHWEAMGDTSCHCEIVESSETIKKVYQK